MLGPENSIFDCEHAVAAALTHCQVLPPPLALLMLLLLRAPNSILQPLRACATHTQDILSLDMYCPATAGTMAPCQTNGNFDPAAEVKWVKPFYDTQIIPRLQPHQKVLYCNVNIAQSNRKGVLVRSFLVSSHNRYGCTCVFSSWMIPQLFVVPGTFGDWNSTRSLPIEEQQDNIVAKVNGYWDWAKSQPLISGINCWHWKTIPGLYKSSPGIIPFYYGVDRMPKVVARLTEIGDAIRKGQPPAASKG